MSGPYAKSALVQRFHVTSCHDPEDEPRILCLFDLAAVSNMGFDSRRREVFRACRMQLDRWWDG